MNTPDQAPGTWSPSTDAADESEQIDHHRADADLSDGHSDIVIDGARDYVAIVTAHSVHYTQAQNLVLLALACDIYRRNVEGVALSGHERIARFTGLTPHQVSDAIGDLCDPDSAWNRHMSKATVGRTGATALTEVHRPGQSRRATYQITLPPPPPGVPPLRVEGPCPSASMLPLVPTPALSPAQRRVLTAVAFLAGEDDEVQVSARWIQRTCQISRTTAIRALRALQERPEGTDRPPLLELIAQPKNQHGATYRLHVKEMALHA